jgi:GntR family transcriptional repressor for pyruvate dehydrogenase complex
MRRSQGSTTQAIFDQMLDRIRTGRWPVGTAIPSERSLIQEFGVSRIPLREALSMLRALGVLDTRQGRGSTIRNIDATVLGKLFPLMFNYQGQQTFRQVFELRLAVESRTAYLAAQRRNDDDVRRLQALADRYGRELDGGDTGVAAATDLEFHGAIAEATKNSLFPLLLKVLSGLVAYTLKEHGYSDVKRIQRARHAHESIAEAIEAQDAERARVEMEAHLRYSASRIIARDPFGADWEAAAPAPPIRPAGP